MTPDPRSLTPDEERARDAVRGLPPAVPDPAFLARLEADFVEGRLEQRERFRRPSPARWAWLAAPIAAAALLAIVLGRGGPDDGSPWRVLGTSGSGTVAWAGHAHDLASLATNAELASAGSIRVNDGWIEVGRRGVVAVRLNPGSDATLTAPPSGEAGRSEWELRAGEMEVLTGPGFSGQELAVRTPEGRVEIVGTAFAVLRDGGATCVCVLEGVARIGVDTGDLQEVRAGLRKIMYSDGRPPQILDIVPEHRAGLLEFVGHVRDAVEER